MVHINHIYLDIKAQMWVENDEIPQYLTEVESFHKGKENLENSKFSNLIKLIYQTIETFQYSANNNK